MQYFGTFMTKYEELFLVNSYIYFNKEDEEITPKELKNLIKTQKDRKRNIVGTIFIYSPLVTPIGYDSNKPLLNQEFDKFDEMIELKIEDYMTSFKNAMVHYEGKVVEVRNLFNMVEKNIDAGQLLIKFNEDLEKYNSSQNTEFDREIMYQDVLNLIPSGKFVFFAWGEKISSKEFPYIKEYAKSIYEKTLELGKNAAFVYKKEKTEEGAIEYLQFAHPTENIKNKPSLSSALKIAFAQAAPVITPYK